MGCKKAQEFLESKDVTVADRTDVLTYVSEPLSAPLHIGGAPGVNLFASTSGTDSDWVVKLIDVYPDEVPNDLPMSGYQLPIAMDIFRGRYRESLEHPSAIPANQVQRYRFDLPQVEALSPEIFARRDVTEMVIVSVGARDHVSPIL